MPTLSQMSGGAPAAHAASHEHGGSDEVATAAVAANGIPKASAAGKLDMDWYPDFVPSGAAHAKGAVPDPGASAGTTKFLREDATWAVPASGGGMDINGLTAADPALGDEVPIYDVSVAGNRKVTVEKLGLLLRFHAGGRLTLTSASPVTTSDVTGAGTLYYAIYQDDQVALYDGTRWRMYTFAERSLALSVTSGKNYDVFLFDNAGTLTLELSAAWTNDTTRADALARQDGVWTKSGAATRRYLGTIRASAANVTEDSEAKRFVWNVDNRVGRALRKATVANHTYGTAAYRQFNADTTAQVEYVCGLAEDAQTISWGGLVQAGASGANFYLTYGVDATNGNSSRFTYGGVTGLAIQHLPAWAEARLPGLGYHYIAQIEYGHATNAPTFWDHVLMVAWRM